MAKVTLYVPDELHERSKKHDEINLSQLLQVALKQKLRELDKRGPDISKLVDVPLLLERFSEERSHLHNVGVRLGVRYAYDITYADLVEYATYDWKIDKVIKSVTSENLMRRNEGDKGFIPDIDYNNTLEGEQYDLETVLHDKTMYSLWELDSYYDADYDTVNEGAYKARPEVDKGFVAGLRAVWERIHEDEDD